MSAAYDALDAPARARVDRASAEHSFAALRENFRRLAAARSATATATDDDGVGGGEDDGEEVQLVTPEEDHERPPARHPHAACRDGVSPQDLTSPQLRVTVICHVRHPLAHAIHGRRAL